MDCSPFQIVFSLCLLEEVYRNECLFKKGISSTDSRLVCLSKEWWKVLQYLLWRDAMQCQTTSLHYLVQPSWKVMEHDSFCVVQKSHTQHSVIDPWVNLGRGAVTGRDSFSGMPKALNLLSVTDGISRLPLSTLNCDQRLLPFVDFKSSSVAGKAWH